MRLLICAGGTGGGVYPALAVLQALSSGSYTALWVGGAGGMEADLVKRTGVSFETISAAGVHGVGLRALPGNLRQLGRGYLQSRRILRRFQPDVLLFTGGYVAVPMALAGRRIPTLLYVPDIEPGLALKTLAGFADRIGVTVEESRGYFSGRQRSRVAVTGYPTRPDLKSWDAAQAAQALGLDPALPTLLVTGGSQGARSINQALLAVLPQLLDEMQVVHLSGRRDWAEVQAARQALSPAHQGRYLAQPYLHEEMGAALTAADLVVSRAGASALGEYPLFGLPAVLVPYPHAWRYQQVNAEYLAGHGAAVVLPDAGLPSRLLPTIQRLMRQPAEREKMRSAMRVLALPGAASSLAAHLCDLADHGPSGSKPSRTAPGGKGDWR